MDAKADFKQSSADTTCEFAPGQFAYSNTHGACVYLVVDTKAARHRAESKCRIRLPFSDHDNHEVTVLKKDLRKPFAKSDILKAIDILRKNETIKLSFPTGVDEILKEGDILKMARLAATLQALMQKSASKTTLDKVLDRITGVATAYVLAKQQLPDGRPFERQPSQTLPFFQEMRERIKLALAGGINDVNFPHILEFRPRERTRFKLAAERFTSKMEILARMHAEHPADTTVMITTESATNVPSANEPITKPANESLPTEPAAACSPDAQASTGGSWFHYPASSKRGKPPQTGPKIL